MTENELLKNVLAIAKMRGWLVFHALPAYKNERWATHFNGDAGFPDLCLVHATGGVCFAELKAGRNKLTVAQMRWRRALLEADYEHYIWYPEDMQAITDRLSNI